MFTLWQKFADGNGGEYWVNSGDNSTDGKTQATSCWLPQYFYFSNGTDQVGFDWSACGSSGRFDYGQNSYYSYSNGDGTTTNSGGYSSYGYSSGHQIYDSGCCQVYFDGSSGYYTSDSCGGGCPDYGQYIGDGCVNTSGYDASGAWWNSAWIHASFFADGSCGMYASNEQTNYSGCYYPPGYWLDYSSSQNSNNWYVYDSCSNLVANGSYVWSSSSSGNIADGNGGYYFTGGSSYASSGDVFTTGYYTDCDGSYYFFEIRSDGMSGYYTNIYLQ